MLAETSITYAERFHHSSVNVVESINPATGKVAARLPQSSLIDLENAITRAKSAFPHWSFDWQARSTLLSLCSKEILNQDTALAKLIVLEQGKPLSQALDEVRYAANQFQQYADTGPLNKEIGESDKNRVWLRQKPIGVAGLITPWNFPVGTPSVKLAPALTMGNTVVLKPSPVASLAPIKLVEILNGILPAGVLNIVVGGNELGEAMARHPEIQKLSLTGSTKTGCKAMSAAGSSLKRLTLELGGNDPAIILPDANPAQVAGPILQAAFRNSGQVCSAIKRLYIPSELKDAVFDALLYSISQYKMGDGLDPEANFGPLTHLDALTRIERLVEDASTNGGKILCGGKRSPRSGYYYPPTLVSNVDNGVALVDEEQFGPALPLITYSNVEEAIQKANDSPFGLSASVWTSNSEYGLKVANRLEAGRVGVNGHTRPDISAPFGGFKRSGIGRELGEWGLSAMGEMQVISLFKQGPYLR